MGRRDTLTRMMAIIGTVLVALPLLAPFALSLFSIGRPGGFQLDYLLPFEVYPVTLVGAALLVWASFRAHAHKRAVGIAIGGMLGCLVLASIAAQATGIANSEQRLETWKYVLTAGLGGLSLLAQAVLLVVGWLLIRDSAATADQTSPPAEGLPGA